MDEGLVKAVKAQIDEAVRARPVLAGMSVKLPDEHLEEIARAIIPIVGEACAAVADQAVVVTLGQDAMKSTIAQAIRAATGAR